MYIPVELTSYIKRSITNISVMSNEVVHRSVLYEVIGILSAYSIYNKQLVTEEALSISLALRNNLRHGEFIDSGIRDFTELILLIIEDKFWRCSYEAKSYR